MATDAEHSSASHRIARFAFFIINFAVAAAFSAGCLYCIIAPESGGAFAGGILGFAPTLIYAALEGFAFALSNRRLERTLGKLNLCCAAFFAFGLVANIAEAFTEETHPSIDMLVIFTTIFGVIISYLCFSGIFRLRSTEPQDSRLADGITE